MLGYPGEISMPLDADHHDVCKFESRVDPRYVAVRNVLKNLVKKGQREGKPPSNLGPPFVRDAIKLINNGRPNPHGAKQSFTVNL